MLLQSPWIDGEADPITRCDKHEAQSECIRKGCTLTFYIELLYSPTYPVRHVPGCTLTFYIELLYPTLSNGITLHRLSSGGSGGSGSGSGLAVAVSMKPPIFSAAPLCISLVMCV